MVFSFTLKGFSCKSGVLHFCIYFLVWLLFKYMELFTYTRYYSYMGTIHIYGTIHVYGYYYLTSTNTTKE